MGGGDGELATVGGGLRVAGGGLLALGGGEEVTVAGGGLFVVGGGEEARGEGGGGELLVAGGVDEDPRTMTSAQFRKRSPVGGDNWHVENQPGGLQLAGSDVGQVPEGLHELPVT